MKHYDTRQRSMLWHCATMLLIALALAVSSSAGAANNSDSQKGTIAILVPSMANPYYAAEANAAKQTAQSLGYNTLVLSHEGKVNRQYELITSAIAKGVEGIILDNAGSAASVSAVRYAAQHNVPVVLINREIPKDGIAIAQLTHNNVQAARMVARKFVQKLGGEGKYVELTCNLADNNCVARSKAFHRVLDQYPGLEMVARQDAKGVLLKAKEIMDSILQAHPNIDGVIAGNGPVALGAIAALQNAGMGDEVVVVGIDGSENEMKAIEAGKLYATAMLQAQKIASDGAKQLVHYIETGNHPKPERQLYRAILITKKNADKVHHFSYGKK